MTLDSDIEQLIANASFAGCSIVVEPERLDAPRFYPPTADESTGSILFSVQENISINEDCNYVNIPLGVKIRVYGNTQLLLTSIEDTGYAHSVIVPKIILPYAESDPVTVQLIPRVRGPFQIPEGTVLVRATAVTQQPMFMIVKNENFKPTGGSVDDGSGAQASN